jgi:glycerophosphoryl diester phosphodiesterase
MLIVFAVVPTSQPVSLRIHAHNDYEHPHPLFDALDAGARSVEADIFLVNGKLLVAHNFLELRADRSLQSLYLDPLRQRIKQHNVSVYGDGETLQLLIDIKQDGQTTYPVLRELLEQYQDLLTHYGKQKSPGPITVVLTGNQPARKAIGAETDRVVAFDGSLNDLFTNPSPDLVPMISGRWDKTFTWNGKGTISEKERAKLTEFALQTHSQGRTLRFWGAPDNEATWRELKLAGVDWINTDRLAEASAFLQAQRYSQNSSTLPSGSRK